METDAMFITEEWQRLYGRALLETDGEKRAERIAGAEDAVAAKLSELSLAQAPEDASMDLNSAAVELSQLKKHKTAD